MSDLYDNECASGSIEDDAYMGYYVPGNQQEVRSSLSHSPRAKSIPLMPADSSRVLPFTSYPSVQVGGDATGNGDRSPLPRLPPPVVRQTSTAGAPHNGIKQKPEEGEVDYAQTRAPSTSMAQYNPVQALPNDIVPASLASKAIAVSPPSPSAPVSYFAQQTGQQQALSTENASTHQTSLFPSAQCIVDGRDASERAITPPLSPRTPTSSVLQRAAVHAPCIDAQSSMERRSVTVTQHPLDNSSDDGEGPRGTRRAAQKRKARTFSSDFDSPGKAVAEEMQEWRSGEDLRTRLPVVSVLETLSSYAPAQAVTPPAAAASPSVVPFSGGIPSLSRHPYVDPSTALDNTTADASTENEFGVVSARVEERPAPPTPYPVTSTSSLSDWSSAPRLGFPAPTSPNAASAEAGSLLRRDADERKREDRWYRLCRGVSLLASASPEAIVRLRSAAREYGIPHHLRAVMWLTLTGMALKVDENEYFCAKLLRRNGYVTGPTANAIAGDVQRTFPGHPYFSDEDVGIYKLTNVLHALCWRNPLLSYCQSFNFLAAFLLLVLDDEERVFWLLVHVFEQLMPNDFYGETLLGANVEQVVLERLVQLKLPRVAAKFSAAGLQVHTLVANWMMSLFVNIFPPATSLLLWDYFLCRTVNPGERTPAHLEITLAVLKYLDDRNLLTGEDAGELLIALREQTACLYDAAALIRLANTLAITPNELHKFRREAKPLTVQNIKAREGARAHEREWRLAQELQFARNANSPAPRK
ncbi:putative GTPase activator protein [Leptomonas seymouri]|uniref:Putative GTPase activator protein n=1 Tax=Leptomonas seymouri TaxID=5684 RepID=A0A0N1I2C6_LEPSE|nr:putative GTPase activator protein [Leptomonas seymouri]|eukprot:KPI90694.1 putative GTPase activator protein [Leptomonas seymouri]